MQIETIYSTEPGLFDRISIREKLDYIHNCDEPEYRKRKFNGLRDVLFKLIGLDGPKLWALLVGGSIQPKIHFWRDDLLGSPSEQDLAPKNPFHVSIDVVSENSYRIECPTPYDQRPWFRMVAFADNTDDAIELLLDGLNKCVEYANNIPEQFKPENAG